MKKPKNLKLELLSVGVKKLTNKELMQIRGGSGGTGAVILIPDILL